MKMQRGYSIHKTLNRNVINQIHKIPKKFAELYDSLLFSMVVTLEW
jgi:hypothetical protein